MKAWATPGTTGSKQHHIIEFSSELPGPGAGQNDPSGTLLGKINLNENNFKQLELLLFVSPLNSSFSCLSAT